MFTINNLYRFYNTTDGGINPDDFKYNETYTDDILHYYSITN